MDLKSAKPSIIIPTLNAGDQLLDLLSGLESQSLQPVEIIIVDSNSEDETRQVAQDARCIVTSIPRLEFQHGRARNLGVELATGHQLVFLSQDAMPVNDAFLEKLLLPLLEGQAQASYARQIPKPEASPLEKHARTYNYPSDSHIRSKGDILGMGILAYFFSNSASAIDREAFESVGRFSEEVLVNEDMLLCAKLLKGGYRVAYQAGAKVYHSHAYSMRAQFQRYFDIGYFFSQVGSQMRFSRPQSQGIRFALEQIIYLMNSRAWAWIPRSIVESGLKGLGYFLGKRGKYLPISVKKRFSRQKAYWSSTENA
jgi:rhamnosyltransferase